MQMCSPSVCRHRIFLIRHGETVDNVAGLYAGSRDSALTNHGVLQASRLAKLFATESITFAHIFSSGLTRAVKTAECILREQAPSSDAAKAVSTCDQLRERDFGYLEGLSWKSSSKGLQRQTVAKEHAHPESSAALEERAKAFLHLHLLPALDRSASVGSSNCAIAIISHGILLSTLWRILASRECSRSVIFDLGLESVGSWSNTGYMELLCVRNPVRSFSTLGPLGTRGDRSVHQIADGLSADAKPACTGNETHARHGTSADNCLFLCTNVKTVNSVRHLKGLKRLQGGMGSSPFDERQASIETYFQAKRRRKN